MAEEIIDLGPFNPDSRSIVKEEGARISRIDNSSRTLGKPGIVRPADIIEIDLVYPEKQVGD